jgi:hypothetical protein
VLSSFVLSDEELNGRQVLGPPVDQRRLRPPQRVRPVIRLVQSQLPYPRIHYPGVLPGGQVR